MLNSWNRKRLVLEYGTLVLKKINGVSLTEVEVSRISEIQGALSMTHDELLDEVQRITTRTVSP